MKSPVLPVSLPAELKEDIVYLAAESGVGVSEFIRELLVAELSRRNGKTYELLKHGGDRRSAKARAKRIPQLDPIPKGSSAKEADAA